jgi:hypothetical protein
VPIASAQKRLGDICSSSIVLAILTIVWFFRLITPFCWGTRGGRKLLINTMIKLKLIERDISELGPIVTMNSFQAVGMIIVQPQSQAPKVFKHFILSFQEENSRVMRMVVNNDKNIPLTSHGANPRRTDSVHME